MASGPDDPIRKKVAAEWDRLVASGVDPDEATRRTTEMFKRLSTPPAVRPDVTDTSGQNPDKITNPIAAFLAGGTQGGMAQFADEAATRIEDLVNPDSDHDANLARARGVDARYKRNHPLAYTAGEVAGSVAIPGAAALRGATWLARATRAGVAGAGMSAASAAGAAEGPASERVKKTPAAAAVGGGIAALFPIMGATGRLAADVIPGVRVATRAERATTSNPIRAMVRSVEERADDKLAQALTRDKSGPETIQALVERHSGAPKPETITDLAGRNTLRLNRATRSVPGEGSEAVETFLEGRGEGAGKRFVDDVYGATGTDRRNILKTLEDMGQIRSQHADELYGRVYGQTVDEPEIARFFTDPAFRKGYERARSISIREQLAGQSDDVMPSLESLLDEAGNLKRPLTIREIDRIKRGVDDVLDVGARSPLDAGGLGDEELATLRSAKNVFLGHADRHAPEYATAREVFGTESRAMQAMALGKKLYTAPYEELELAVSRMTPLEREAFQKGGAQAAAERIRGVDVGGDIYRRVAGDDIDKDRLRLLFPDEAQYDAMAERFGRERRMHRKSVEIRGGSQTVDKALEGGDLADVSIDQMASAATGSPGAIRNLFARLAATKARAGLTERTAEALGRRFTTTTMTPDEFMAMLAGLSEAGKRSTRGRVIRGAATTAGAGMAGSRIP